MVDLPVPLPRSDRSIECSAAALVEESAADEGFLSQTPKVRAGYSSAFQWSISSCREPHSPSPCLQHSHGVNSFIGNRRQNDGRGKKLNGCYVNATEQPWPRQPLIRVQRLGSNAWMQCREDKQAEPQSSSSSSSHISIKTPQKV